MGDPSFRAVWELLAILISLVTWGPMLQFGTVACVETDSEAAMIAAAKLSSNTANMNALAAEIGFRVVGSQVDLRHISGVSDYEADAVSSLHVGKDLPAHLQSFQRSDGLDRDASFFLAWPRELVEGAHTAS